MTQQFLHTADIHPAQHQVRGVRMPQRVRRHFLIQPRGLHRRRQRPAHPRLMRVMPPLQPVRHTTNGATPFMSTNSDK